MSFRETAQRDTPRDAPASPPRTKASPPPTKAPHIMPRQPTLQTRVSKPVDTRVSKPVDIDDGQYGTIAMWYHDELDDSGNRPTTRMYVVAKNRIDAEQYIRCKRRYPVSVEIKLQILHVPCTTVPGVLQTEVEQYDKHMSEEKAELDFQREQLRIRVMRENEE